MPLRFGHLNYLNTLPLYAHLAQHTTATLVPGYPSELNAALSAGTLDVSLVSSWAYLKNRDIWDLLPGFCIATDRPIGSVNLYHRVPLEELHDQPLAVTSQSATSVQLLRLLCRTFWHLRPRFETLSTLEAARSYPAFLLIGDEALTHQRIKGYQSLDLAAAWFEKTQLPMTFAVLAARCPVLGLLKEIDASLAWAEAHPQVILEYAMHRSGLCATTLRAYYDRISYRLEKPQWDGLRAFAALSDCPLQQEAP